MSAEDEGNGVGGQPSGSSGITGQPGHLQRDQKATQTVDELRHSELEAIHRALARLCQVGRARWRRHLEWDKIFGAGAILFIGAAIGGGLGLFPFFAAHPSHVAKREYIVLVAVGAVLGVICVIARMAIKGQQIESIHSVYDSVDKILKGYEPSKPPANEGDAKP